MFVLLSILLLINAVSCELHWIGSFKDEEINWSPTRHSRDVKNGLTISKEEALNASWRPNDTLIMQFEMNYNHPFTVCMALDDQIEFCAFNSRDFVDFSIIRSVGKVPITVLEADKCYESLFTKTSVHFRRGSLYTMILDGHSAEFLIDGYSVSDQGISVSLPSEQISIRQLRITVDYNEAVPFEISSIFASTAGLDVWADHTSNTFHPKFAKSNEGNSWILKQLMDHLKEMRRCPMVALNSAIVLFALTYGIIASVLQVLDCFGLFDQTDLDSPQVSSPKVASLDALQVSSPEMASLDSSIDNLKT